MVELVATAIAKIEFGLAYNEGSPRPHWKDFEDHARAALAAMREPTEAMNEAGYSAACEHDYGETTPNLEIAPATFNAMIDAALSESQTHST